MLDLRGFLKKNYFFLKNSKNATIFFALLLRLISELKKVLIIFYKKTTARIEVIYPISHNNAVLPKNNATNADKPKIE